MKVKDLRNIQDVKKGQIFNRCGIAKILEIEVVNVNYEREIVQLRLSGTSLENFRFNGDDGFKATFSEYSLVKNASISTSWTEPFLFEENSSGEKKTNIQSGIPKDLQEAINTLGRYGIPLEVKHSVELIVNGKKLNF